MLVQLPSEFEVTFGGRSTRTVGAGRGKQARDIAQVVPSRLVQCRVRADQVADHIPRSNVERAFGWRAHGQRDGALRAEADPLGGGFLTGPYPHGLREHIYGNGFVSCF
jgi:hypothetical protein